MPERRNPEQPPAAAPKRIQARFTNRVTETTEFLRWLDGPQGAPLPLLMFYGVGGAGKTELLKHLQRRCDMRQVPWAAVDLFKAREADEALPRLAAQLEAQHGMRFDRFKRVLVVLAAKEAGGAIAPTVPGSIQDASQPTDIGLDLLGLLPMVGQLAAAAKLAKSGSGVALRAAMRRNKAFGDAVTRLGGEGELLRLIEWDQASLQEELLRSFALDLSTSLPQRLGQAGKAVLFLDTHEALWRDASGGAISQDAWIRRLREYLDGRGVLVVVAGRDRLNWPREWADQRDPQGNAIWLKEVRVGGLSARDALEFLHRAEVEHYPIEPFRMPEALRGAILRVTNEGTDAAGRSQHYCYLLALCAEIVANTQATSGAYPAPDLFDTIPPGDAALEPLARRFLRSLPNQAMVGWLQELSLTPRFDRAFALALAEHRRYHTGQPGWERLTELSLLEERQAGFLELHTLLREALRARVTAGAAVEIHIWAYQYWSNQTNSGDGQRRGLAWYHQRAVDHDAAMAEFLGLRNDSLRRADGLALRCLAHWWHDVPLHEVPRTTEQAGELSIYGTTLARLPTGDRAANLAEAIACYNAALRVYTEADFPVEWATAQNNLGSACALSTVGDQKENAAQAIACFEAALRVHTEADFPILWAMIQNNLGAAFAELPSEEQAVNVARAIACFEATLRVYTEADFPVEWATAQNNLGNAYVLLPTGDHAVNVAQAIAYLRAALRVRTEADFPIQWAMTQNNLGNAYAKLPMGERVGNLAKAIACFEAALRVRTEADFPIQWAMTHDNLQLAVEEFASLM